MNNNTNDEILLKILRDNINQKPLLESLKALASVIRSSELKGSLYPFGSFCNGFPVDQSDLDVVFISKSDLPEEKILRTIDNNIQKSKSLPKLKTHVRIFSARIPILKIKDETNQVDIDLSINNINGIINSKLLLEYSKLHPKIEILGKLLKLWGKKQGIISQSGLSSYALILAMIYYLQQKHNIPCLQQNEYNKDQLVALENLELNPYFKLGKDYQLTFLDNISLKQLFEGFFDYYQSEGEFSKSKQFISINGYNENATYRANTLPMFDPINKRHDPSKKFKGQTSYYQKLFKQTLALIQRDDFETIFQIKSQKIKEKKIKINQKIKLSDEELINALKLKIQIKQDIGLAFDNIKKHIESKFPGSKLEKIGDQNESYEITQCDIDCNITTEISENIDISKVLECLQDIETYNIYKNKEGEAKEIIVFKDQKLFIKIHLTLNFENSKIIHQILMQYMKLHPKIKFLFQILKVWSLQQISLCKLAQAKFSYFHFMMIHFLQYKYNITPFSQVDPLRINNEVAQILQNASILEIFLQFLTYYQINGEFQSKKLCLTINGKQIDNPDQKSLIILNPLQESDEKLLVVQNVELIQQYFSQAEFIQNFYKLVSVKNKDQQKNPVHKDINKGQEQTQKKGKKRKSGKETQSQIVQLMNYKYLQQKGHAYQKENSDKNLQLREKKKKEMVIYVPKRIEQSE